MIRTYWLAAALGTSLLASVAIRPALAEDAPAAEKPTIEKPDPEQPKTDKATKRQPRVTGIWAKLSGLSDEQKQQIESIHRKMLAERRKLEEQAETDITALLTDEQKKQLETLKDEESARRKEMAAKKKEEKQAEAKKE